MREILFRGKSIEDNKWIYGTVEFHLIDGDLTQTEQETFITYDSMDEIGKVYRDRYKVDPATVCQFTGLTDKNATKIFEGDVVIADMDYGPAGFYKTTTSISWNSEIGGYQWNYFLKSTIKIVGNIYDNPEMLIE